eukprot:PhM_4_TR16766/c0_g2_i1/m.75048
MHGEAVHVGVLGVGVGVDLRGHGAGARRVEDRPMQRRHCVRLEVLHGVVQLVGGGVLEAGYSNDVGPHAGRLLLVPRFVRAHGDTVRQQRGVARRFKRVDGRRDGGRMLPALDCTGRVLGGHAGEVELAGVQHADEALVAGRVVRIRIRQGTARATGGGVEQVSAGHGGLQRVLLGPDVADRGHTGLVHRLVLLHVAGVRDRLGAADGGHNVVETRALRRREVDVGLVVRARGVHRGLQVVDVAGLERRLEEEVWHHVAGCERAGEGVAAVQSVEDAEVAGGVEVLELGQTHVRRTGLQAGQLVRKRQALAGGDGVVRQTTAVHLRHAARRVGHGRDVDALHELVTDELVVGHLVQVRRAVGAVQGGVLGAAVREVAGLGQLVHHVETSAVDHVHGTSGDLRGVGRVVGASGVGCHTGAEAIQGHCRCGGDGAEDDFGTSSRTAGHSTHGSRRTGRGRRGSSWELLDVGGVGRALAGTRELGRVRALVVRDDDDAV